MRARSSSPPTKTPRRAPSVVRQAVEAMDAIAKSSQQISQIIGVIDEIAFQTNLLALNAGRRGGAGGRRGPRLRGGRLRSARAGAALGRGGQGDQGPDFGFDDAGRARRQAGGRDRQVARADHGAGGRDQRRRRARSPPAPRSRRRGSQEVNTAINQMDQVTQQNAAMVEESTAASHSLVAGDRAAFGV